VTYRISWYGSLNEEQSWEYERKKNKLESFSSSIFLTMGDHGLLMLPAPDMFPLVIFPPIVAFVILPELDMFDELGMFEELGELLPDWYCCA
jgi:hypothetical protein